MQIDVKENESGSLLPFSLQNLPFAPKRFFVVKNKFQYAERGNHAHINENHFLICLGGTININYEDSAETGSVMLKHGDCFYQKELQWLKLVFEEENSCLLVFADSEYTEKNYIRDYYDFCKIIDT